MNSQFSIELLAKFGPWASGVEANCSAHLQMGVLTGLEAIDADLEIGATTRASSIFARGSILNFELLRTFPRPVEGGRWANSKFKIQNSKLGRVCR
jgi:hypothetical protein